MHGFDEFFGNLYHLNAEEEPEQRDYPSEKDFPNFRKKFGPRGVLHCKAKPDGTQEIRNTGPLSKKRMETVDEEFLNAAVNWVKKQHKAGKPWFMWFNTTHMHLYTHEKSKSRGQAGRWQSEYHDVMIDHDNTVGKWLDLLDELGITNNTIVLYSTDNGPHMNSWPDAGMTPFRSEKDTNWEGAYRVPAMIRWPGKIKAGSISNDIFSHLDWLPTFVACAGDSEIKEKLLKGYHANNKTFKVHLDGYNMLPYLTGKETKYPRQGFFYFSDDGDLTAVRYDNWKFVFMEQRVAGTLRIWAEPFTRLRVPKIFNLRTDPYERADVTSNTYYEWMLRRAYLVVPTQQIVGEFLATFKEFPPRQKAASFTIDQAMEQLEAGMTSS